MSESNEPLSEPIGSGLSRRDLFRKAGLATSGVLLLGLPEFLSGWTRDAQAAMRPDMAAGTMALELDGQVIGQLISASGGNAFAELVAVPSGTQILQKQIDAVRFEDLVIEVRFGPESRPLATWINQSLTEKALPKNGAIIYADNSNNERKRLEFVGAVISEAIMPNADVAGAKAATMTIRLTPQSTQLAAGRGGRVMVPGISKGRPLITSSFRLNIQGLEMACRQIRTVEGIGFKRLVVTNPGEQRIPQAPLGPVDLQKVSIQLPEADAAPFYQWFDETVLKGRPGGERAGLIEWLDPAAATLASIQLGGLGIVRYAPEPTKDSAPTGSSGVVSRGPLMQVDMYYGSMNVVL